MGRTEELRPQEECILKLNLQALYQGWKQVLYFFGHQKLKSIEYYAFLNRKYFCAAHDSSVGPTVGAKSSDNASRAMYTSNLNKYQVETIKET